MNTADLIKNYRKEAGMTQEQVANQLYIAKNTYSQYENGIRKMDSEMFLKILAVLGIRTDLNYMQLENTDTKSLLVYKDTTRLTPRFQMELYEYDPIRKKHLLLDNVNGGFMHPGWLEGKEAIGILEYIRGHFKDIVQIDWETYDTFDYVYAKNKVQNATNLVCSLGFLTRLFQKCIEEEIGFTPFVDGDCDEEYISFAIYTNDEDKGGKLNELLENLEDENTYGDTLDSLFSYYFHKKIRRRFFDNERDIFTFVF